MPSQASCASALSLLLQADSTAGPGVKLFRYLGTRGPDQQIGLISALRPLGSIPDWLALGRQLCYEDVAYAELAEDAGSGPPGGGFLGLALGRE